MNKKSTVIIACLTILLLVSCTPSASVVETAIANTQEALPTFTRTLAPTATVTNTPAVTLTPKPSATLTPKPEVGNIPGLSRAWVVTELFEGELGVFCNPEELEDGLHSTKCNDLGNDSSSCVLVHTNVIGRGEDTVDGLIIGVGANPNDDSHKDCQNILLELSNLPYSESTPEIVKAWLLENLNGIGPDSDKSIDSHKIISGVEFHLTKEPDGAYILTIK